MIGADNIRQSMNASLKMPPYNPEMLRWAREWRGRTIEETAQKLKKRAAEIQEWETNESAPTVRQARILAEFYGRPFLEFFLSAPPEIIAPSSVPDFRVYPGVVVQPPDWALREILVWIETHRTNALDLYEQLGEAPPTIGEPLFSGVRANPETHAGSVREAIKLSFADQVGGAQSKTLHDDFRARVESLGILTLRSTRLRDFGIRGVCIAEFPLPVITFGSEAPTAQIFTLAHEVGHVLLRETGITGFRDPGYRIQPVERWCDQFAASLLMQRSDIVSLFGAPPGTPEQSIDDTKLRSAAKLFGVSAHAMMIRLVHIGYVSEAFYWNTKKPEFDQEEARFKAFGRARYYGTRYKGRLGDLYTGLVLEAWAGDKITNHNAAEYMGITNLSHLYDIRKDVLGE